jgi:hypothetical protein
MPEYIERDKVLSKEEFFGEHATWDHPMTDGCMAVRSDFIMNLPAADVAPVRHGRWIEQPRDFDLCGVAYYQCSECGKEQQTPSNYCQFCGAKMDKGE